MPVPVAHERCGDASADMSAGVQSVTLNEIVLAPNVRAVYMEGGQVFRPPSKLTVSQWAERDRMMSSETSAWVGNYRVSTAPYQRAMMDSIHIPGVGVVVYFTAAQMVKSTALENLFGYFVSEDPCPIIWL